MPYDKMKYTVSFLLLSALLFAGYSCGSLGKAKTPHASSAEFVQDTVVTLDLGYLDTLDVSDPREACLLWDHLHALATLQGIVNRECPRLYLFYIKNEGINIDRYWWDKYRQQGRWLSKATVVEASGILDVVERFRGEIDGAVVYDPKVNATSNVASSVAGVENLVAVRYDASPRSLYSQLIQSGPRLPVKVRLLRADGASMFTGRGTVPGTDVPSSGSAKIDAYAWFMEKYMKTGKMNTAFGAYYIDQHWQEHATLAPVNHHTLTNHDFFVARKGFFFDLSPWGDEKATDDLAQSVGADRRMLEEMLLAAYRQNGNGKTFTYIGGFPAWAYKYTRHAGGAHGDVDTEWEYSRLISAYNAFKDADAIGYGALANASFWQHYPLRDEYPQKWTTEAELKAKGYLDEDGRLSLGNRQLLIFYVGDYDASSWLSQTTPTIWDAPERGKLPLMWCVSPVLAERVPMAWEYKRETATANDYFAAADNGAGYLTPGELQEPRLSGLPSGVADWARHCKPYYKRWGLTVTGFVIDGFAKGLDEDGLAAYASFSPNGIVPQKIDDQLYRDMPVLRSDWDIVDNDPRAAAAKIVERVQKRSMPFHWFRNILKTPAWYVPVVDELKRLDPDIELVDAPTFFELYRIYLKEREAAPEK